MMRGLTPLARQAPALVLARPALAARAFSAVIRPVGEWVAETGQPGADPAGVKALQRFLDGKPPSFVTDISYRMAAFRKADNSPEDSQLSLDEFKALMKDLPLSKEIDVELLFHQADANKDGVLVFDEFVNCFEHVTGSALAQ